MVRETESRWIQNSLGHRRVREQGVLKDLGVSNWDISEAQVRRLEPGRGDMSVGLGEPV